jgi:hypothetical protein
MPKVVPFSSAVVPGARNAPAIGIQKDHTQMVKFPSKGDRGYEDVSGHVKLMVAEAIKKVEASRVGRDALEGKYVIWCASHSF